MALTHKSIDPRPAPKGSSPRVFIVADDLTGACDSAAPFAARGLRVEVQLASSVSRTEADVVVLSTESRDVRESIARHRLARALREFPASDRCTLFKKIDSVCRGNTFAEIAGVAAEYSNRTIIFTPAFPAVGRRVQSTRLLQDDVSECSIDIREGLETQGIAHSVLPGCSSVVEARERLQSMKGDGSGFILCDASTSDELSAIAHAALSIKRPLIWIGSGGLAHALASALNVSGVDAPEWELRDSALLLCIGSKHPVSASQIEHTMFHSGVSILRDAGERLTDLLAKRAAVFWTIDPEMSMAMIRTMLKPLYQHRSSTILLSGGGTAAAILESLSAAFIQVAGELLPGIPWGILRGGDADGMRVITKSGGFGKRDTLTEVVRLCCGPDLFR